jgi:tetratricopeptide (TPR) repeat protein
MPEDPPILLHYDFVGAVRQILVGCGVIIQERVGPARSLHFVYDGEGQGERQGADSAILQGASDPCDRRIDPETAALCYLAGGESEGAFVESQPGWIRGPVRIANEFLRRHAGVIRKTERVAVGERDAGCGGGCGQYDRAIEDFDASIKLDPDYAYAFANRAQTYLNKGEYVRAVQDYGEAIRLKPALEGVWNGRCWTRAIIGELQAALADCNEALRLKPDVAATLDSRGLTYLKMGQWDSALDDYSSALRIDPKLASSFYGRGLAKLKKGDTTGGNADVAAAKAIEANIVGDFVRFGLQ